eukprot:gene21336-23411_t
MNVQNAWDNKIDTCSTYVEEWKEFMSTEYAKANVFDWTEQMDLIEEQITQNSTVCSDLANNTGQDQEQEDWMQVASLAQHSIDEGSQFSINESHYWSQARNNYTTQHLGEMPQWIALQKSHTNVILEATQVVNTQSFTKAYDIVSTFKMEQEDKEIIGFIQNVSPLGQGQSKKYFDFSVQTENDVVRAVCFSPVKRKAFDEASMKKSPVKIKKFIDDRKQDSNDILMNDKVMLEELDSVYFERREPVPEGLIISGLTTIMPEQLVNLKAKVINLQKPSSVNTNTDNPLQKQEGLIIDQTGSIKIVFWESDVGVVREFETLLPFSPESIG